MELPDQSNQVSNAPVDPETVRTMGWFEANKTVILTTIIAPIFGYVAKTGIEAWLEDRKLERTAAHGVQIELLKIQKKAEVEREQIRLKYAHDDALREQEFQRMEQQQSSTQRQNLLTFYSAVLAKLDQADGLWWIRPSRQYEAAQAQFDRIKLLPIYAEAQKIIADNMALVILNPTMRGKMAEFGKNVASSDFNGYYISSPHGALRYDLQWAVQTMSQRQ